MHTVSCQRTRPKTNKIAPNGCAGLKKYPGSEQKANQQPACGVRQPDNVIISIANGDKILAIAHEDMEGVELDLRILPARVQAVEIRSAIDAEQQNEVLRFRSAALDDQRESIGPIMPVTREDALAVALESPSETIWERVG
jgi:hypothetical protein